MYFWSNGLQFLSPSLELPKSPRKNLLETMEERTFLPNCSAVHQCEMLKLADCELMFDSMDMEGYSSVHPSIHDSDDSQLEGFVQNPGNWCAESSDCSVTCQTQCLCWWHIIQYIYMLEGPPCTMWRPCSFPSHIYIYILISYMHFLYQEFVRNPPFFSPWLYSILFDHHRTLR